MFKKLLKVPELQKYSKMARKFCTEFFMGLKRNFLKKKNNDILCNLMCSFKQTKNITALNIPKQNF